MGFHILQSLNDTVESLLLGIYFDAMCDSLNGIVRSLKEGEVTGGILLNIKCNSGLY